MKRIPDSIVAEIKQANDIVSVVEQYLPLQKKSSSNYFGLCPFHSEDTPSFSVNPREQFFYCFGCHKGGDVVSFIKEIEHLDYGHALRFLAERSNIQLPEIDDKQYLERKKRADDLQSIMLEAARYFFRCLSEPAASPALNYLKKRQIQSSDVKRFGLGYAPERWDGLVNLLRMKGFSEELILSSGLCKRSERGNLYDLFRNRLIFPIISPFGKGKVIGFGGRVLDDSKPKYINSPETEFFTKGKQLYALNLAKKSSYDFFLLVEGYLDVMAAFKAGVDAAVAPLGTALTTEQAKLMKQFKSKVMVCFDADRAGMNAALRSFAILEEVGLEVSVLNVPDGKDPDDYVRSHGTDAFKSLISEAQSVFDYRLLLAKKTASEQGSLNPQIYLQALLSFLPDIKSESLKEVYLARAAKELGVSLSSIRNDVKQVADARSQNSSRQVAVHLPEPLSDQNEEQLENTGQTLKNEHLKRNEKHYQAALSMVYILSRQSSLIHILSPTLDARLISVLGPESFVEALVSALNSEDLHFKDLYHFINEHHPEPDDLISNLTGMHVKTEKLLKTAAQSASTDLLFSEDLKVNFKRCRRFALKEQLDETYQSIVNPDTNERERASKKLLYNLLHKELSSLH